MNDAILKIAHLTKRFPPDPEPVIADLSLTIPRGGRVTLFAPTGAGKSTLIHILSGLDRAYEGGFELAAARPVTVFQEPRLFPYMTVEENILLPLRLERRQLTRGLAEHYHEWLEVCDLVAHRGRYPHQLSGGMKQKVALIRGFLPQPDFAMLDEPFKSLDRAAKGAIIRHIRTHYPHVSLLFVTHALEEAPLLTESLWLFTANRLTAPRQYDAARLDLIIQDAVGAVASAP